VSVAVLVLAALILAGGQAATDAAQATSNTMSGIGRAAVGVPGAATPQQLAPAACGGSIAGLAAVVLVPSHPYVLAGSTNTLLLGRGTTTTVTGGGGADCVVGGGGLDTLAGGPGADVCLGPVGTTFTTVGANACETTGSH
jgi:Ca2+-binding RTX toxin-like protein